MEERNEDLRKPDNEKLEDDYSSEESEKEEDTDEEEETDFDNIPRIKTQLIVNNTLHCTSAVLASQLRKVLPSVDITNMRSSIALPIERASEMALRRRRSAVPSETQKAGDEEESVAKLVVEEVLPSETEVVDEEGVLDEEAIQEIPVDLAEKRQLLRRIISVIAIKKPWYKKVKEFYAQIQQYADHLEVWNKHLTEIEGRFGAGIASYFLFLRMLFWMNIMIFLLNFFFLVFPAASFPMVETHMHINISGREMRKINLSFVDENIRNGKDVDYSVGNEIFIQNLNDSVQATLGAQLRNATHNNGLDLVMYCYKRYIKEIKRIKYSGFWAEIQNLLQGTGWLEPTLLFIGYYPVQVKVAGRAYSMTVAFCCVFFVTFLISLMMMFKYSSFGLKEALLSRHDIHQFTNEILCGWDYCIRNSKAASLHREKFLISLKSNLSEAKRKMELEALTTVEWIKLYATRTIVHVLVIFYIMGCYVAIYYTAVYQVHEQKYKNLLESGIRTFAIQYLPSFTMVTINLVSPILFAFLVSLENYHGQKGVNVSIIRNAFLQLSSIIVLVISFHKQISCQPRGICGSGIMPKCSTPRCWETYVGQQLYRLCLLNIVVVIVTFMMWTFPREYFVKKYKNKCTQFIGRPTFALQTEILSPIYTQLMLWLGVFYSPLLPGIGVLYIIIIFYVKKAAVLNCSQPSTVHYRASRFNSAVINILIVSFFAVLSIHLYAILQIPPSLGCGPFRYYSPMIQVLYNALQVLPFDVFAFLRYILSGWFFTPAAVILCVVIYHCWKYMKFLKNAGESLKADLFLLNQDKKFLLQKIEALEREVD